MQIKSPKDFWTGVMYLVTGVATIVIAHAYPMGVVGRMGPAYFPTMLGALLSLVGVIALIRSFLRVGLAIKPFAWRSLLLISASVLLFGVLVRGTGLIPALMVLIVLSAKASVKFQWRTALALAAGLTGFCALLFVKALGVPLPLVGPWLGV